MYIAREDGEHFVIPSYRDVITARTLNLLKQQVLLLSSDYGEYVTIQRKSTEEYEVAFSPDTGYLLGETVWHYFKRPSDLIYCEALPNSSEAILVIVKSGSVYLDGTFPIDAIPDELVIFRTQKNNFEIYTYGDVPIADEPEEGKFAFDPASVKSFNVLNKSAFEQLPLIKSFQLQLVNIALREKGVGVLPVKRILVGILVIALIWMAWKFITSHKKEIVIPQVFVRVTNPYQTYLNSLSTPDPSTQIKWLASNVWLLSTIPGWYPDTIQFSDGKLIASVKSMGARTNLLYEWAAQNHARIDILSKGFILILNMNFASRPTPDKIYNLNKVIANMTDTLSYIIPGNNLELGDLVQRGRYSERQLTINFANITASTLDLIGEKLKDLPLVLTKVSITLTNNGILSGSIVLKGLGN